MRIRALVARECLDLVRNPAALVPVGIVTLMSLLIPFLVVIVMPAMLGRPLAADPELARLSGGSVEGFLFDQFLLLFLLTPITGAMSLAAHAIVGEKQARTLEPLLATPITTLELLVAKVLGALLPTLAISAIGLLLYVGGIALFAQPGVFAAMATPQTFVLVALVGPAAALVALQAAIVVSCRVNDARTAQQFGVLIILPLTVLFVAQFTGWVSLTVARLTLIGFGLVLLWLLLAALSVALFDRETILTRWR